MSDSDPRLNRFEEAWQALRDAVAQAEKNPDNARVRQTLVDAVDEATVSRFEAREALAAEHSGNWIGDQILFVVETRAGAWAQGLDGFIPTWTLGGGSLTSLEILALVKPLILQPGEGAPQQSE